MDIGIPGLGESCDAFLRESAILRFQIYKIVERCDAIFGLIRHEDTDDKHTHYSSSSALMSACVCAIIRLRSLAASLVTLSKRD